MLTHRNIVANTMQIRCVETQLTHTGGVDGQGDRLLAFLPFFHIYGEPHLQLFVTLHESKLTLSSGLTCSVHFALYYGWVLVVMAKFELERMCQHVQDFKIDFLHVVPPIVLALAKHPVVDKYDLSSIRMMNSGAAPLTRELVDALYKRNGLKVKQGYGLSETSPTTHTQEWDDWQDHVGSVGKLQPNLLAKYMSPDEKEVPVGEVGELWMKGPNIFVGYWKNPTGTAQALTPDGYFKTGDVGYQDKDGHFFITDRVKELIKYKGFQVPPAELEGLLVDHENVEDVAVIGIYDEDQATEVPRAYCVVKQGIPKSDKTAEEIISWTNGKVAPHKRLRGGVRFVDEIPKSASGKILRRVLKERAQQEDKMKAKL